MKLDRRSALTTFLAGGAAVTINELVRVPVNTDHARTGEPAATATQEQTDQEAAEKKKPPTESAISDENDRQAIMTAGFTELEADCWKLVAQAAGKFFELPELHPLDTSEVVTAVHLIQNKLLSRPTYRTYVAEAKKLLGED